MCIDMQLDFLTLKGSFESQISSMHWCYLMFVSYVMIISYVMGPSWHFSQDGSMHANLRVLTNFFLGISHSQIHQ